MKRILSILIIIALLLSFAACNNGDGPGTGQNDPPTEVPATINGVYVTSYRIVYDAEGLDYNERAAAYVRDKISEYTGSTPEMVDDSEPGSEYEIVIGETSRDISRELDEDTEGFQFAMLAREGTVAIEADYFVIAAAAYYLIDEYFCPKPLSVEGNGSFTVNTSANKEITIPDGLWVKEPVAKKANNLIMLIGDGMGVHQTLLYDHLEDVSDYSDGEDFFYGYMFPYQGFSRTASLSGVTDSAAGGTALSSGYKTYNEYVGLDRNGNEIKSLTELAAELGKATAVMSTENKTGATPSTFSSHTMNRDNSDEILDDQLALSLKYGTVIDCGYDYYTARYMRVIENHIADTLGKMDKDEDGFFLMYEEAHIDKKCHNNDIGGTFLALIRFNQAIARFMEYAFYHPDTAVLITADHETGGLRPGEDGTLSYSTENHTRDDVPVFAWGEGFECLDGETVENIEIAKLYASLMGVESFGDQSNAWYDDIYGE